MIIVWIVYNFSVKLKVKNNANDGNTMKVEEDVSDLLQGIIGYIKFLEKSAMKNFDLSKEEATELLQELGKFYVLKIIEKDYDHNKLSPSEEVDELWHLHLLFPKKYYQFCARFARNWIDHSPDAKYDGNHDRRYSNTIKKYRSTFNADPPYSMWPKIIRGARKSAPAC